MNKLINKKQQQGFTLIELLVVISIIAVLSSVILAGVQQAREKAQISKVRSELAEFVKALEIYKTSFGSYPTCDNGNGMCALYRDEYGEDNQLGNIINQLRGAKIYSGDLEKIIKSIPKLGFLYVSYNDSTNPITESNDIKCFDKTNFPNYYISFYFGDAIINPMPILGLDSSYVGKETNIADSPTQGYCAGN